MPSKTLLEDFIRKALKNTHKYPNIYWIKEEEGIFGIRKKHAGNHNYDLNYDRIYKDWEEMKPRKKTKTCMKQRLYGALRKSPDFKEVSNPNAEDKIYEFTNIEEPKTSTGVSQPSTHSGLSCESQESSGFETACVSIPIFNVKCDPSPGIECYPESSHQNVEDIQHGDHTYSKILYLLLISNDMEQPCFPHPNQVDPLPDPQIHQLENSNLMQHPSTSTHMNATSVTQPVLFLDALAQQSFGEKESLISAANLAINQPNMEANQFLPRDSQESVVDSPPHQVPGACDFERETCSLTLYDSSKRTSFGDAVNTVSYEDLPTHSNDEIPNTPYVTDEDWALIYPYIDSTKKNESSIAVEEGGQNCGHPLDDFNMETFGEM